MTRREWLDRIDGLRDRVARGDATAMYELALEVQDGLQDRRGRTVVRRAPAYAFRLFATAAGLGVFAAAAPLGFAYDVGLGIRPNRRQAIRWYRRAVRAGSSTAASNLATVYRDAGSMRAAVRWWKRAADLRDGDAMGDVGYCYQYGIGVRRDTEMARRWYRRSIASQDITEYGREEALYHLAVSFLDESRMRLARPILLRAAADGDYPEAMALLEQIRSGVPLNPCRCRRYIRKTLRGHAWCPLHSDTQRKRR